LLRLKWNGIAATAFKDPGTHRAGRALAQDPLTSAALSRSEEKEKGSEEKERGHVFILVEKE
jgi:hypothetical protein